VQFLIAQSSLAILKYTANIPTRVLTSKKGYSMSTVNMTGSIKVIRVPQGEAPRWVRVAWVGLILPCDPYLGYSDSGCERGVVSNSAVIRNRYGVSVSQVRAIEILSEHHIGATLWWKNRGFPCHDGYFCFSAEEVQIVHGVVYQEIEVFGHSI